MVKFWIKKVSDDNYTVYRLESHREKMTATGLLEKLEWNELKEIGKTMKIGEEKLLEK